MLWHRLWLVLLIYLVGTAALQWGLFALGVSGLVKFAVGVSDRGADRLRSRLAAALEPAPPLDPGRRRGGARSRGGGAAFLRGLVRRCAASGARDVVLRAAAARHRRSRRPRPTCSGCFRNPNHVQDPESTHERRDRRLRLRQSALGREGVRARRARERTRPADRGDARSRRGAKSRPRGAARCGRLRRLPPRARRGARHGRGAGGDGARQGPAVPRHLRRHAAHGRTRPRICGDRRARLDPAARSTRSRRPIRR